MKRKGGRPGASAKTGLPRSSRAGVADDQGTSVVVEMARRFMRDEARESFASRGKRNFRTAARSVGERSAR